MPRNETAGSPSRKPLVKGRRVNAIDSPPPGPDPESPVEYRDIPDYPGCKLGADGSVWCFEPFPKSDPPAMTWRWIMPDVRPDRGREVLLVNLRGSRVRLSVDLLMEAIFPPEPMFTRRPAKVASEDRPGGRTKLDPSKVAELRRLKSEGWTYPQLQARFGISRSSVHYALANGWKYVMAEDETSAEAAMMHRPGKNAKVTRGMAAAIKELAAEGLTQSQLAQRFGLSITTIANVVNDYKYNKRKQELASDLSPGKHDAKT